MINSFDRENSFLSNFYTCPVIFEGIMFLTVENAFQAAKTLDVQERLEFTICTPGQAKRLGRRVQLRPDWNDIRISIMKELVLQKFSKYDALKSALLRTDNQLLIEGNNWNDRFWGVCDGVGENHLGKILMEVRDELKGSSDILSR